MGIQKDIADSRVLEEKRLSLRIPVFLYEEIEREAKLTLSAVNEVIKHRLLSSFSMMKIQGKKKK